jgi:hypothetical protein
MKEGTQEIGHGLVGSVLGAPAMAGHFPAYRWRDAVQPFGDDPHRVAAGDSAGDVFAFGQRQRTRRAATDRRSDTTMTHQQKMDDVLVLAERATDRM